MVGCVVDLSIVREQVNERFEQLLDRAGPYGCYRRGTGQRPDLYATLDVAIARSLMGENLMVTLGEKQRREWIDHINSYAHDGCIYEDRLGFHSMYHANGMVISALSQLGGRQPSPFVGYEAFASPGTLAAWLEAQDWTAQWHGSHEFWGGMHCFSFSRRCNDAWRAAMFDWLDRNLDESTGWWRKGMPYSDRHQPLGGGSHIIPVYEHHNRPFPYPERTVDSVLAMQLPNGRWQDIASPHIMGYLELDALYVLHYLSALAGGYRTGDINRSVARYADAVDLYRHKDFAGLLQAHPHAILAAVGVFGLLQRLLPDRFRDSVVWSDIFSERSLYRTDLVEALADPEPAPTPARARQASDPPPV
jgi:hypothetical protein